VPDDLVLAFSREFCISEVLRKPSAKGVHSGSATSAPTRLRYGSGARRPTFRMFSCCSTPKPASCGVQAGGDRGPAPAFDLVRTLDTTAVPDDERPRRGRSASSMDQLAEVDWEGRRTAGTGTTSTTAI
jgi:hypothetical protein